MCIPGTESGMVLWSCSDAPSLSAEKKIELFVLDQNAAYIRCQFGKYLLYVHVCVFENKLEQMLRRWTNCCIMRESINTDLN